MRRSSVALFGAAVFIASIGGVRAATSTLYTMDQPIDVVLTQRVSSESAHTGDAFYFKTVSDVHLGDVELPAGTPGSGRLATAVAANRSSVGQIALQADSLVSGSGATVWVNIDTTVTPRGHFSSKRDIVLDPGMAFRVKTIAPRHANAPLIDTSTPTPTATPAASAAPSASLAPSATARAMQPSALPSPAAARPSASPSSPFTSLPSSVPSALPSAASPRPSVSPSATS